MPLLLDDDELRAQELALDLGLPRRCCYCARYPDEQVLCLDTGFRHDHYEEGPFYFTNAKGRDPFHEAHLRLRRVGWSMLRSGVIGDDDRERAILDSALAEFTRQGKLEFSPFWGSARWLQQFIRTIVGRQWQEHYAGRIVEILGTSPGGAETRVPRLAPRFLLAAIDSSWKGLLELDRPQAAKNYHYWQQVGQAVRSLEMLDHDLKLGRLDTYLMLDRKSGRSPRNKAMAAFGRPGILSIILRELDGEEARAQGWRYLMNFDSWTLAEAEAALTKLPFDAIEQWRIRWRTRRLGREINLAPLGQIDSLSSRDLSPDRIESHLFRWDERLLRNSLLHAMTPDALVLVAGAWGRDSRLALGAVRKKMARRTYEVAPVLQAIEYVLRRLDERALKGLPPWKFEELRLRQGLLNQLKMELMAR